MPYMYRAYHNNQSFSAHDSVMPKATWIKISSRKDAIGPDGLRQDVTALKKLGWTVKRVEVTLPRVSSAAPPQIEQGLDEVALFERDMRYAQEARRSRRTRDITIVVMLLAVFCAMFLGYMA